MNQIPNLSIEQKQEPPVPDRSADMGSRRILGNTATNLVQFIIRLFVSFWQTRFFIRRLSPAVYGMYPLSRNLVDMLSLFTGVVGGPALRNLMVEHAQNRVEESNRIFNSLFFGLSGAILVCLPLLTGFVFLAPQFLHYDPRLKTSMIFLFSALSFSFITNTAAIPFQLSFSVRNKIDLGNYMDLAELAVFVGVSTILVLWAHMQLTAIAVAIFLRSLARLGFAVAAHKSLLPELVIDRKYFDWRCLADILSMSAWFLLGSLGFLLIANCDLLLINLYLGADATGRYGSLLILYNTVAGLNGKITGALLPPIMARYARNGLSDSVDSIARISRFIGIAVALPVGLTASFSGPLFSFWLGRDFAGLGRILFPLMLPLILESMASPINAVRILEKKVAFSAVLFSGLGLLKLGVALALLRWAGLGMYSIALSTMVLVVLNSGIGAPLHVAWFAKRSWSFYFPSFLPSIVGLGVIVSCGFIAQKIMPCGSVGILIMEGVLCAGLYCAVAYRLLMNGDERELVRSLIRRTFAVIARRNG